MLTTLWNVGPDGMAYDGQVHICQEGQTDGEDSSCFCEDVHFPFFLILDQGRELFFGLREEGQQFFGLFYISMEGSGVGGYRRYGRRFPSGEEGKDGRHGDDRLSCQFPFHVEETEHHEEGGAAHAEVEAQPVGVSAQGGVAVQEKAHGEAAAPVGDDHEDEGNPGVLQSPENALDGGGNGIKELPAGAVDKELPCNHGYRCIVGVYGTDVGPEEDGDGSGDGSSREGYDKACFFIPFRHVHIAGADGGGNEDGEGHGAGYRQHVDEAGKVVSDLVRRQGIGAVAGQEYDDEAEQAHFHENGEAAGYAYDEVFLQVPHPDGEAGEDFMAPQFFCLQDHQQEQGQKNAVGHHGGQAGADAAQGRHAAVAIDEEVVQHPIHRRRHEEELHGNGCGSRGVREAAKRNDEAQEEDHADHGHEIIPGDVGHRRFQGQGGQKVIDEEEIGRSEEEGNEKTDRRSASHDEGKAVPVFFPDELGHEGGAGHEKADDGGQERIKEARSHRYAGQVVGARMSRHGGINKSYSRRGYLGHQDRYHH